MPLHPFPDLTAKLFYLEVKMEDFKKTHFALMDLTYTYLDDGFTIVATTDVPCHLFLRMSKKPPWKHVLPAYRRGLRLTGDIRFCFTVFEDNDQEEAGDTLQHTFIKGGWPFCEHRWFYFVGEIDGQTVVSETCIFEFHFPAPPPDPPPPMLRVFFALANNRTVEGSSVRWSSAHNAASGTILTNYDAPFFSLWAGSYLSGGLHYIYRSFLSFDTSTMPLTAKLVSAELSPHVYIKAGVSLLEPIHVTRGVQHDPVIPTDFGAQLPFTTSGGESHVPALGYQPITLNSYGLAFIEPGAISKFCLRGYVDLFDRNPSSNYNNWIRFYTSQKGTGYHPTLAVTYYPA